MISFSSLRKPGYALIGEDENKLEDNSVSHSWKTSSVLLIAVVTAFFAGFGGYLAGNHASLQPEKDWLAPAGSINHTFHYRKVFTQPPTNETEKIWEVMFPRGRGFIQNPAISPDVMGVAVYHQLHCLDSLRRGYYAALNASQPSMHLDKRHMRHCIDYLRQSLLCAADTNFEPVNRDLGGVTGWGNPRQCRDIVRVLHWSDRWRAHNQTGIL